MRSHDRDVTRSNAQAYTLEGLIGSFVIVIAILLALNSIVISPMTTGPIDRGAHHQLEQQANDILLLSASEDELTSLITNWDIESNEFENADTPEGHRAHYLIDTFGNTSVMNGIQLGSTLNANFERPGSHYNLNLIYQTEDGDTETIHLVYSGSPAPHAISAGHTVTIFEDDRLSSSNASYLTLAEASDEYDYPIPNVKQNSSVHNVVEIRVVVW